MKGLLRKIFDSRSVLSGALLYIAMRWFDRLAGVVSTIILARLLTPDDFGIVAIATVVLGLAMVMLDFGIQVAVVQLQKLDRDDIDTAWTLRLIQNAVIAVLLIGSAGYVATYYHDPRLQPVLVALGFAYLLEGLTGMGPVVFQKQQQYAREVAFFMAKRAGSLVVTIALALWLRNYWALVIGTVVANVLGVVLSYAMYRVAPRLTLSRWRSFVGASLWLSLHSVSGYASQQLDKLVVGRRDGAAMLGAYSIADQISAMPTSELLAPISRALFPAMAAIQGDQERLRRVFLLALGIQSMLALPAAIGLALVSSDLVAVVLGPGWNQAAPIMLALALAYGVNALTHSGTYLLNSLARYRELALLRWAMLAVLVLLIFVVSPSSDARQIAWFRGEVAAIGVCAVIWLVMRHLPGLSVMEIAKQVVRPALASLVMAGAVLGLQRLGAELGDWQRLAAVSLLGAVVYVATTGLLWKVAGRPPGAEEWVLQTLRSVVSRLRNDSSGG